MNTLRKLIVILVLCFCMPLQASEQRLNKTISVVQKFEGFSEKAYWDVDAYSIGYGTHLITPDLVSAYRYAVISKEEAQELLTEKIMDIHNTLLCFVNIPLNDNQYSALVSFTYNVGISGLIHSKVLTYLNAGQYRLACKQLQKWIHVKHRINRMLIKRRRIESALFLQK
jgi:lysozyme